MRKSPGKRLRYPLAIAMAGAVLAPLAAGAAHLHRGAGASEASAAATVQMTNGLAFQPTAVRIRVGETVTWRNTSQVPHSVTADPRLAANRTSVRLPAGAATFNAANIAPGRSYSHTFTVAGEYRYFCIPHEAQGMTGTIVVTQAE